MHIKSKNHSHLMQYEIKIRNFLPYCKVVSSKIRIAIPKYYMFHKCLLVLQRGSSKIRIKTIDCFLNQFIQEIVNLYTIE